MSTRSNTILRRLLQALKRVLVFRLSFPAAQHGRPRLVRNLAGGFQSDPNISTINTATMITSANSLLPGSGMPNQVAGVLMHAMSGSELSRVRTELY